MFPDREADAARLLARCLFLAPAWFALLWLRSGEAAFVFFLASRGAYVCFVGLSLRAQDELQWFTRRWGAEEGFSRFRRAVSLLMTNDAVSIMLVCWLSRGTLRTGLPDWTVVSLGMALAVFGVAMKSWAVSTLGTGSYYWRSFFISPEASRYVVAGPYRWFDNPMYTAGYAHAYGLALVLHSVPGLIAALVAQSLVLLLNHFAEKPHTERMRLRAAGAADGGT